MRLLVCGGRDFTDAAMLYRVMDRLAKAIVIDAVIEGDARGADRMAGFWARKHGVLNLKFPAEWGKYGKRAGPMRNMKMLVEGRPDLVVAFPGGAGTEHMIRAAIAKDVQVVKVKQDGSY